MTRFLIALRLGTPESPPRLRPVAILDGTVRFGAHGFAERGVADESRDGIREILHVAGARDEAGLSICDEILRPALIGDDARHAAREGFEDDVAEGVGGAGKKEHVG